jgi:HJR/Mrr/RecB family endonuclease
MPLGGVPLTRAVVLAALDRKTEQSLIKVVGFLDRRLLEEFHRTPELLTTMERRQFERLIVEIFDGFGYDVELTQRTRDGGKDIVAVRRREIETRLLIECKRPDSGHPVDVSIVRELLGVKVDDGATKAILATTTRLTRDASAFVEKHRWELEAAEYDRIVSWISEYLRAS